MEMIQGARGVLVAQDGFLYRRNRMIRGKTRYLWCAKQTCKVRAKVEGTQVVVSSPHNHPPDTTTREILNFRAALREAALNSPLKKPRQVFLDVCGRFPHIASELSFTSLKSQIYRYQAMGRNLESGEEEDIEASDLEYPEVDDDVASQLDFNSMSTAMSRARKSGSPEKEMVDSHEIAGSLNIESQPCSSKSNIQFVTSDLDYLHDMDFGTIEESGLGHFTSTPIREKTATIVGAASVQERVEKEMEAQTSVAETQKTLSGSVEEDDIVMICPIDNVQPSVSQSSMSKPPSTQAKSTKQQLEQKREGISEVDTEKMDINAKKLQSAIDKLENISNRLIAASLADKYDQFGKYISSILRGFPPAKVNALKKKLVSEVLEALHEEEQEPAKTMKSTGTQVAMDKSSDTAFKSYLKEKENVKSVPTSTVSLGTNIPVVQETLMTGIPAGAISIGGNIPYIGGNMPIIFPGASTSSSYQLLPVFPMSASPRANVATMVTTQSLVSPVVSVQPLMASESVTTVAKSATGTLLAVTIPKPQMTETAVPGSKEIRGQKRQKTAAYIIKKCKQTHTLSKNISPSDESSSDSQSTSNGTQTEIVSQPEESDTSIDSGGRDMSRSGDFISQTPENRNMQSEGDSKNTGGRTVCQSVKSELQIEHEFQMDVEEGKELTQMKKDQEMFETVLCEGTSSTDIYIKEEAPDPEEPSPMTPSSTSPFECHLCHKDCRDRQELTAHLATSHFGAIPPVKEAPGGNQFEA